MHGPSLAEMNAFVAVLERKSFTKAAKQLRLSTARVSEMVRNLEERLGVRLVERTTRSVASTTAGERLLERLTADRNPRWGGAGPIPLAPASQELFSALRSAPVRARCNDWGNGSADNIRADGLYSPHKEGRRHDRTHDHRLQSGVVHIHPDMSA
jgi:hypothetical protein